jgi:hypothetical protein
MMLVSVAFDSSRPRRDGVRWGPPVVAGSVAAALAGVAVGAESLELLPRGLGRGVAGAAIHGGFLAIGWMVGAGECSGWKGPVTGTAGILFLASLSARFTAWGGLLYLLAPVLLVRRASRVPALRDIGVRLGTGLAPVGLGLAAGTFLGFHLLISASLTFGYAIRLVRLSSYLVSAAQDVGANALTAEWLFRGALFSRYWRRWDFWPAATLSTALAVCRYLLDPLLSPALEVRAGTVFYMSLVGFTACALRAATESLLPGYLTTITFLLCYRLLAQ